MINSNAIKSEVVSVSKLQTHKVKWLTQFKVMIKSVFIKMT